MKLSLWLLFTLGTMLGACSESLFGIWLGLEVSSMAVYPIILSEDKSESTYSAVFKYFVVQTASSCLLHLGLVVLWGGWGMQGGYVISLGALLVKFGGPFVGLLSSVAEGISWLGVFIVLGAQKIPLIVLLVNVLWMLSPAIAILLGVSLGVFSVMCQCWKSARGLVIFSSVLNSSWIWCALVVSHVTGVVYFIAYVMCLICICSVFSFSNCVSYESSFYLGRSLGILEATFLVMISGIPPSIIFFCKVEVVFFIISEGYVVECWFLMILSVFMIYMYVNLAISNLFLGMLYSSSNNIALSSLCFLSAFWGVLFLLI